MKNSNIIISFLLLFFSFQFVGFSQSGRVTGKLEGIIKDAETGEPLIGANVIVTNTYYGATTDADGYYVVLNVPAGTYTVEVHYIGYTVRKYIDVVVSPDRTTTLNSELSPEVIEGETVVVVANKPIIKRDVTGAEVELASEDIKRKPVTTFTGVIQQQAGAVNTGAANSSGLHIRGGRANELVYYIDGVNTNDPANNGRGTNVDINSIEQLKIITGGFNAEYGEAMSGVVQIITKSGPSNEYVLYAETQSNDFMNGSRYDNGYNKYVANLGGPIPFTNRTTTFFASASLEKSKIQDPSNIAVIRRNSDRSPSYTFKLQSNAIKNLRFFISGNYNKDEWLNYDHVRSKGVWLDYTPRNENESYLLSTTITHTLSKKFFYDLTFSHFYTSRTLKGQDGRDYQDFRTVNEYMPWVAEHTYTPSRENPDFNTELNQWQNGWTEEEAWLDYYHGLGYFDYGNDGNIVWNTPEQMLDAYQFRYWDTGHYELEFNDDSTQFDVKYIPFSIDNYKKYLEDREKYSQYAFQGDIYYARYPTDKFGYFNYGFIPWWHERSTKYYSVEGAFQGQINKQNFIKIGGTARFSTLELTDIQFLNLNPYFDYYKKKPTNAVAYIQDKFEFEDMVINVGLRYDYFHPHSKVIKDFNDISKGYKEATYKDQLSPRFGIAFAVSDKTVMRANYGHFFQVPDLSEMYQSIEVDFTSGVPLIGNADLPAQKETMYAVGLKHRLSSDVSVEVSAYYKDIQKLLSTRQQTTQWQGRPAQYTLFEINDFAKVKGIDLTIGKRPSRFLFGSLTYSFMDAKGTGSDGREFYYRYANIGAGELPRKEYPLEFDVTHSIKLDLNFYLPREWGPQIFGYKFLEDINTNLYFNYNSGPPYTPEDLRGNPGELGSGRLPSTHRADLRVEKFFNISNRFRMSLFSDIRNLFNTENITRVWLTTGKVDDNGYRPPFEEASMSAQAERWGYASAEAYYADLLATWKDYVTRPNYFGIPRIIRFGVSAQLSL